MTSGWLAAAETAKADTVAVPSVKVDERGLVSGDRRLPLLAASIHYFQLSRGSWRPALEAIRDMGARIVDTYVPWSVHEVAQGAYDFGESDPRLDVGAFLELAHEIGLAAIVRPGPHINAELTGFGVPERVLWNEACQARSPGGAPVILPAPPLAFPVPSYASRAFFNEATLWLAAVSARLSSLRAPRGPIVLVQIDNEAAFYFRDGVADQDYHPDAIEQYRRFVRSRYRGLAQLRAAYGGGALSFETVSPPAMPYDPEGDEGPIARHLDWAEFQELLISGALYRFAGILRKNGLSGLPTFHNLPMAEAATPLDPSRVERSVEFVAADYYHLASEPSRRAIAQRTSELAHRAAIREVPAYGAEVAAGQPAFFPPMAPEDNAFNVMAALAYGLRGFNVYMAVARDRWVGGPFDARGRARDEATFWTRLLSAFERTHFDELVRPVSVWLVVPRMVRRLLRVLHAFGPVSATAFSLSEGGGDRGAFEEPMWKDGPRLGEVFAFITELADCLERAHVPFGFTSDDLIEPTLQRSAWTICVCPGALPRRTAEILAKAVMSGHAVSVGPRMPERDEILRPSSARIPIPDNAHVRVALPAGGVELARVVDAVANSLDLPRLNAEPLQIKTTLHHDTEGRARVLFVLNPDTEDHQARVQAPSASGARDALSGELIANDGDRLVLRVPARTVRMLELSPV